MLPEYLEQQQEDMGFEDLLYKQYGDPYYTAGEILTQRQRRQEGMWSTTNVACDFLSWKNFKLELFVNQWN